MKDMSSQEERYCPLCDKREKRSECAYGEKAWDKVSVKDEEYSMARSELKTIEDAVKRLGLKVGKGEGNLEAWVQSKITKAADYIDTAADYVGGGEMDESINHTIDKSAHKKAQKREKIRNVAVSGSTEGEKSAASGKLGSTAELPSIKKEEKLANKILSELEEGKKKGLWDNIHAKRKRGERPAKPGERGYPKTLDIEEGLKQARKNVGASKCWTGKKVGNPPTKMKGGKEVPNCVPEDVTIEDANGNTFAEIVDLIKPDPIKGFKSQVEEATRLQSQSGNILSVMLSWKGRTYSIKMFFPQAMVPKRQDIEFEIQKIYPGSRVLHFNVSDNQSGLPLIVIGNNRSKNYLQGNKTIGEGSTWTKKEGQNSEGGLNEKGRKSYERENPGSDLKAPSKKVGNPRRASFCARMKGMKSKLTSKKTASDPDSRINKSLRAWNC